MKQLKQTASSNLKRSVFALAFMAFTLIANAEGFTVDGITYEILSLEDWTVQVGYEGLPTKGDVEIPEKVEYKGLTFDVVAVSSLVGPDGSNPNLNSLKLPKSIKRFGRVGLWYGLRDYTIKKLIITDLEAWNNIEFCLPGGGTDGVYNPLFVSDEFYLNEQRIDTLTIPNTITEVKSGVFSYSKIKALIIPKSVSSIGSGAFHSSEHLKKLEIPSSLEYVGSGAFSGCDSLESVHFEDGCKLEKIDFIGGRRIKDFHIPQSAKSVFFSGSDSLRSISFPANIEEIEGFKNCPNLEIVESYIADPFPIDAFDDLVKMFATLYVPYGTKAKYEETIGWKGFANIVEFDAVGIQDVRKEVSEEQRYLLNGRKTNSPVPGINIIRMGDGKVKKVLVK